jgi:hypothetical protein
LKRGVRQQWGEDEPTRNSGMTDLKSSENLIFRIKQDIRYKLQFVPGTSEYVISKTDVSAAAVMAEAHHRGDEAAEKMVYNNKWMKDLSADEVDQFKRTYLEKETLVPEEGDVDVEL